MQIINSQLLDGTRFKILNIKSVKSYSDFLLILSTNKKLNKLMQVIIQCFLLISFFVMIAGFSAYFNQEFKILIYIPAICISILCYITFKNNTKGIVSINTILMVDEAHILLSGNNTLGADFLAQIQRRARKYNSGTLFITQQPSDFADPAVITQGKAIFDNASYYLIMGLKKQGAEHLSKLIDLNNQDFEQKPRIYES